jgi:tetratricopeptide (TPR) repeat protein
MSASVVRRVCLCAAAFGCFIGFASIATAQVTPAGSTASRAVSIVVFPFENSGKSAQFDWVGEGIAELTADQMRGHGPAVSTREERLAVLEKMGVPAYAHFSRATMLKIAAEMDADYVVFGEFEPQAGAVQVTAHILTTNPPRLAAPVIEAGALDTLAQVQARAAWRMLCEIQNSFSSGAACDAGSQAARDFVNSARAVRPDAFEFFIKGLVNSEDDIRLRDLHEAARLDPEWDEPDYALGRTYYTKRDCEAALQWLAKVPARGPHSTDARFETGVCSLLRNDPLRAEAAFTSLAVPVENAGVPNIDPEVVNDLGVAKLREARYRDALADFARAQNLDPAEPDYNFNLGLANYLAGDPAAAVHAFREAARLAPEDSQSKALLIAALDRSGAAAEANALRGQASATIAIVGAPSQRDVQKLDPTSLSKLARVKTER